MRPNLHAKRDGDGPAVVLLHGLFGAGGNLGALARSLRETFSVFSLDLPNHGRSGWLEHPDLPSMAECLRAWLDEEGIPRAHLVGHSLGGKVAMQLALGHPERVQSLLVADIAPVSYSAHHDGVFAALTAVADVRCASREAAARLMTPHVQDTAVIQFLLTSLYRDPAGSYQWRFDLEGIRAAYPDLLAAPRAEHTFPGPVLFIRGGASDYIQKQHWPVIMSFFPAATLKVMPDCGHWLHVENPRQFNGIAGRFLTPKKPRMLTPE